MASVALTHLTTLLQAKKLDGTLTRPLSLRLPTTSSGVEALDQTLTGGWPRGHLSEVIGPASSGRTSVVMATFAGVTARGGVVALVDVADRFDPESAAEAGVDLDRLLWVRGPSSPWCKSRVAPRPAMRPDGKARRPRIPGVFEGGATPPAGMQRRSNAAGLAPRAARPMRLVSHRTRMRARPTADSLVFMPVSKSQADCGSVSWV